MHVPSTLPAYLPWVGSLVSLGLLIFAMRAARKQRLIDGLPTCKTTGVFIGLVEVKGTAEAETPLTSYLAAASCVAYSWTVEEHWSRTVTETVTDSKGRSHTRTRHEQGWTTVAKGGDLMPFYLRDDCGVLLVRPQGAKLEQQEVFEQTCHRHDPLYYAKGPDEAVANSDHRRRFREVAIPLHAPVYVIGPARERAEVVAAEIAEDRAAPLFLVSTRAEQQISRGYAMTYWVLVVLALLICGAAWGFGLTGDWPKLGREWLPFIWGAAGYLVVHGIGWVWMVFNSLVDLRNRVASAWSQIDVQLKRRFDLIPRMEAVVKGLQRHERDTQQHLAALRAQQAATAPGVAGPDFHALAPQIVALIERYPELTAQPAFLKLQQELVDTEQRIALARGYYNEIATQYNTQIAVMPAALVAGVTRLTPRALMAAADFERAPVKVALA